MAEVQWQRSGARKGRRKQSRDIRDFIVVHGKKIKPSHAQVQSEGQVSPPHASSRAEVERGKRKKRRQVPFPHSRCSKEERKRERELKIPASCFSKGVRKKAVVIEDSISDVARRRQASDGVPTTHHEKTNPAMEEKSAGKENTHFSQTSVVKSTALREEGTTATRRALRLLPSSCPVREVQTSNYSPSTPSPITSAPLITMETTPLVLVPSDTENCVSTTEETAAKDRSHAGSDITWSSGHNRTPCDDVRVLSPCLDLSLSLSESPHVGSLSLVSWDTDGLLAELSSCEKL